MRDSAAARRSHLSKKRPAAPSDPRPHLSIHHASLRGHPIRAMRRHRIVLAGAPSPAVAAVASLRMTTTRATASSSLQSGLLGGRVRRRGRMQMVQRASRERVSCERRLGLGRLWNPARPPSHRPLKTMRTCAVRAKRRRCGTTRPLPAGQPRRAMARPRPHRAPPHYTRRPMRALARPLPNSHRCVTPSTPLPRCLRRRRLRLVALPNRSRRLTRTLTEGWRGRRWRRRRQMAKKPAGVAA